MQKLVLFGAGKIGRSFIGQVFSRGGYEVVFIDIFQPVIDALNEKGRYRVVVKSNEGDSEMWVENVRGVLGTNKESVVKEIVEADIMAVSVGQVGLNAIMPVLAAGLLARKEARGINPVDLIIAENLRNASEFIREGIGKHLPEDFPLDKMLGLVESSIGKMVPIMRQADMEEDILQVFSESYNFLVVDAKGFINPIPTISDLRPKDNMKAWVDRKLFVHNLGHATTAYLGYLHSPEFVYLYEALEVAAVQQQVKDTMMQAGALVCAMYPADFSLEDIERHVNDLINRFKNRALGDTIFRVGCDLRRKLSREDRLVAALVIAREKRLPYDKILYALVAGCFFRAKGEDGAMLAGDVLFAEEMKQHGLEYVFNHVCGLDTPTYKDVLVQAYQLTYEFEAQKKV